ncbi:MAG: glycosyltransferase [Thermoanaerobaculia bacterium]|nr:glycosyltransferase [Thermoanaerobaculia bacterium]
MSLLDRILLTGGGTAGHVNPALAIGAALAKPGAAVLYVGVKGRAEEHVVVREGLPLKFVRASGFPGLRPSAALLKFVVDLGIGILQAAVILMRFRPTAIVGTGGFVAAPVVFAAAILKRLRLCRAPVFLQEQNAVPGKLNQVAGRLAERVFVTFPETLEYFPGNGLLSGYPLRERIGSIDRETARARLDFRIPEGRTVVFAFGGSQGARTLNRGLVDALRDLIPHRDRLFVVHGTGLSTAGRYDASADTQGRLQQLYTEEERELINSFYVARPYFHNIECLYALADLCVVRAGAGTLNELARAGLPALVIPKANLPGDHQVANARAMQRAGGAEVLYEEPVVEDGHVIERIDGSLLAGRLVELAFDGDRLSRMARAAARFHRPDALGVISRAIRGEGPEPVPHPVAEEPLEMTLPSNTALLSRLEAAVRKSGKHYKPHSVIPDAAELQYYRSRAASLLVSPGWEDRNLGVKLLGLLGATDKVPLIVALLSSRTPAPLLERLFGGDFAEVGFIRRNALTALGRLGVVDPAVEETLLTAFRDPYYEVRCEAARVVARFGPRLTRRAEFIAALSKGVEDRDIEAAGACAEALGQIGGEEDALPVLLAMREREYWKVRSAALKGIITLVERGKVTDLSRLETSLAAFPLISTDFVPQFELKANYKKLLESVARRQGDAR